MNGAAYTLPARNRGKPGELTLMIGLALCLIAPFVLVIIHTEADEHALLKVNGVVAEGEVVAHDSRENSSTSRKGRDRSTTSYLLEVRFDVMARTPYAEWARGAGLAHSRFPALTTTTFEVSQPEQAASPVGSRQTVTFLPGDPGKMKLVSTVEAETSAAYFAKYYAAIAAMMLAGAWLIRRGWRQRMAGRA
ncbi:hypothetical protein FHS52_001366 [Erythromicrobium ramosum]|uniref:DUF3592 domain-containing protein n=1 Tax=Erythrobacter ramosus TaxID=35811 RepID=A0A6I4UKW4_9SPHN|nr:DUF3592 domain-containing protein [Erythrobacter ramosus]MBB3775397.1 hypothetical protein [Erythrobacter ramosus]MXP39492.1 hypothetical protein [Erythrobacter ramosus]